MPRKYDPPHVPGPDDPGYRERLKGQPPLDEWERVGSPEWKRRQEKLAREARWTDRIVTLVIVAFFVAIVVWGYFNPTEPGDEMPLWEDCPTLSPGSGC